MGNNYVEIGGQSYPANLGILLREGNPNEYEVKMVHYLELFNGQRGFFPAIISRNKNPQRIVLTTSRDLLDNVYSRLPKRNFKIKALLLQVHTNNKIGYKLNVKEENSTPILLMDKEEFDSLVSESENPFMWSAGFVLGFNSFERLVPEVVG